MPKKRRERIKNKAQEMIAEERLRQKIRCIVRKWEKGRTSDEVFLLLEDLKEAIDSD